MKNPSTKFLDTYFISVWISLIIFASSLFYLVLIFLQSPPSFTADDAVRVIPWVLLTCLVVAVVSALVTPALYIFHQIAQRQRRLSKTLIKTFE